MSTSLLDEERAKYVAVWGLPAYRRCNHGLSLWQQHRELYPAVPASAIDIGCGNGRLVAQWRAEGIDAIGIDFAPNAPDEEHRAHVVMGCLWDRWPVSPLRFDVGNCTDVMEHIPPEKVDAVLANIASACRVVVFKIANYVSAFGDGRLHLTLQNADWWLSKLAEHGHAEHLRLSDIGCDEYAFRLTT